MRGNLQKNPVEKELVKEIDLKELFFVIKRRLWIIIIFAIVSTSIGYYLSKDSYTPLYETSTRMIMGVESKDIQTLKVIIKDSSVLDKVVKELKLEKSADALASQITVGIVESSRVLSIDVVDTYPDRAAQIANTTAKIFQTEVPNIIETADVEVLSEARVKSAPINENNQNRTILIAAVLGIIAGVGFVFLLNSLDETIKSDRDAEMLLGVSVLGNVTKINKKNLKRKSNNKKSSEYHSGGEKNGEE